tara:strand:- start:510 stop:632 length:123 start_codon:yes stop_codon:yes gene_type:complete
VKTKNKKTNSVNEQKQCPSGFYRNKDGKCVQAGVGPEFRP